MQFQQMEFLTDVAGRADFSPQAIKISERERADLVLRDFADLEEVEVAKSRRRGHWDHAGHDNSAEAMREDARLMDRRREEVFGLYEGAGRPLTDREALALTSYPEVNCVQPRITELVQAGRLFEFGKKRCAVTGKRVRVCAIALDRGGQETAVFRAWKKVVKEEA